MPPELEWLADKVLWILGGLAGLVLALVGARWRGMEREIKDLHETDEMLHGRINGVKDELGQVREEYVHNSQLTRLEEKIEGMRQTFDGKLDRVLDHIIGQRND